MLEIIKQMFGLGKSTDYSEIVKQGATILDVRSKAEFQSGHIKGSINIPVDSLNLNLGKINKSKPVITCCASGMRSSVAKQILLSNGFTEVHNGGGWMSLQEKI